MTKWEQSPRRKGVGRRKWWGELATGRLWNNDPQTVGLQDRAASGDGQMEGRGEGQTVMEGADRGLWGRGSWWLWGGADRELWGRAD